MGDLATLELGLWSRLVTVLERGAMQCRIEDRRQDSRIVRFIRASFKEGDGEGGMGLMQACSYNATRKTAADDDIVEVLLGGHDDVRECVLVCQGIKTRKQAAL